MATRLRATAAGLVAAVLLLGCATTRPVMEAPRGFAAYDTEGPWTAVSPEGVVVRLRLVENKPPQTLAFWTEALRVQMEKSGYTLTGEETLETTSGEAAILEWAAPVGEDDWIYLTGLAVVKEGIALAEAAGVYEQYQKHRQAILDGLGTLVVR